MKYKFIFNPFTGELDKVVKHPVDTLTVTNKLTLDYLTATRIPFVASDKSLTDDSNFVWDNTNKRLGINVTPSETLSILQGADNSGIKVYGYDDQSANWVGLKVSSSGTGALWASNPINAINLIIGGTPVGNINSGGMQFNDVYGCTFGNSNDTKIGYYGVDDTLRIVSGNSVDTNPIMIFKKSNLNVGVGTTTPSDKLDVYGNIRLSNTSASNNGINGYSTSGTMVFSITRQDSLGDGSADLAFGAYRGIGFKSYESLPTSYEMYLTYGKLGIGTTTPTAKCHIVGSADTEQLIVQSNTTQTDDVAQIGDVSAGNYTAIEDDGTMRAVGTASCFRDEQNELTKAALQNPSSDLVFDFVEGTLDFENDCDLNTYAIMNVQVNHDWKAGSDVEPHIHWFQNQNAIPNWLIQYRWQRECQAKTTSWTSLEWQSNVCSYVSGTINQITSFGAITPPANYGVSDILQFRVIRDCDNDSGLFTGADAYTGDAEATSFDVHIEVDTLGSRQLYAK